MATTQLDQRASLTHSTADRPCEIAPEARDREQRFSYHEFSDRAARISGGLTRMGLKCGDKVGLVMGHSVEFYPLLSGIRKAGMIPVPIDACRGVDEIAADLDDASVKVCFVDPEQHEVVAPLVFELANLVAVLSVDSDVYRCWLAALPMQCDDASDSETNPYLTLVHLMTNSWLITEPMTDKAYRDAA